MKELQRRERGSKFYRDYGKVSKVRMFDKIWLRSKKVDERQRVRKKRE